MSAIAISCTSSKETTSIGFDSVDALPEVQRKWNFDEPKLRVRTLPSPPLVPLAFFSVIML
ncbi:hypothetical protein D3C75_1249260 [compost metagenome]